MSSLFLSLVSPDPSGAQNPSGLQRDVEGRIDKSLDEIMVEFKFFVVLYMCEDKRHEKTRHFLL